MLESRRRGRQKAILPVLKYTVQLYYHPVKSSARLHSSNTIPQQVASGVLIKRSSKYFLLTCKHVFDHIRSKDVIILTSMGFAVRLPTKVTFINNETDSIDLALLHLKGERVRELKSRYSFLPAKHLGFDHIFDPDLYYMFVGFLNKKTILSGWEFYSPPFGFLTNFRPYKKIKKLGFNYDDNITLEYSIRKQSDLDDPSDERKLGPKELKGLSGGGIWLSVAGKRPHTYNYLLLGIMIEERLDRGFIIGTKIDLIKKSLQVEL